MPTLLAMDEVRVAWVTDADARKAKSVSRAYGVESVSLPENLDDLPKSDIVLLAIPYGARDPYYEALRGRNIAIYAEKPFSRSVEHHQRICSWFPEHRLACGYQRRGWGPTLLAKEMVEAELFGQLRSVRYGFGGPGVVVGGRYNSNARLAGGGVLFEVGIHGLDATIFITSATAAKVKNATMVIDNGLELHVKADLILTTPHVESISCELTASWLEQTVERIEFHFDDAVMTFSLFSSGDVTIRARDGKHSFLLTKSTRSYPLTSTETFYEFWSSFLAGLRFEQANFTSASRSILTTEAIENMYRLAALVNGGS